MRPEPSSLVTLFAPVLLACAPPGIGEGEGDDESAESSCQPYALCPECSPLALPQRSLDVVLVVDGSAGSQAAQARLVAGLDVLIATLEAAPERIDYRIAVTTTDMGAPPCTPTRAPAPAAAITSPCTARLGDFVDAQGVDHGALCSDHCSLDAAALAQGWVERDGERLELPDGVDPAEALRCLALVGVSGCPYEAPLAAFAAFGAANPGFFRSNARRAFVIVSDGADCSWTPAGLTIFDPDGERAFWSDPLADAPTPALCWNAGMSCTSDVDPSACAPTWFDASGTPTAQPGAFVLRTFDDLATSLDTSLYPPDALLVIAGVLDPAMPPQLDPAFVDEFGFSPICETSDPTPTRALPAGRLAALVEQVRPGQLDESLASICADDWTDRFAELGAQLVEPLARASCLPSNACDVEPTTARVEVECVLDSEPIDGGARVELLECARDEAGYRVDPATGRAAMPSDAVDVCFVIATDVDASSEDPLDDADPRCLADGSPGSIELVTRDGRSHDAWVVPKCSVVSD